MRSSFQGKAVLVTGATRGIGYAIALELLQAGATVGVHGRDRTRLHTAAGELQRHGHVIPLEADLHVPEAAAGLVRSFIAAAGRLDGLVNNAGGGRAVAFRGLSLEAWRRTFALNVEAAFMASAEAYRHMREHGGTIVNMASLAAHGPGKWLGADYAASKAALISLTRSLAFEAARFGIRVNAVSPGFVETDMTAGLTDDLKRGLGIPLGRLARPEEIAHAVRFLLSPASAYLTGEVLHVDGGLHMRDS